MGKISNTEINYIEVMAVNLVQSLKDINSEYDKDRYIYSSSARAKFDRLRVELGKELMKIRRAIYAS